MLSEFVKNISNLEQKMKIIKIVFVLLFVGIVLSPTARAIDCLDCHVADAKMGKGKAMVVDPAQIEASVHDGLDCTDCHSIKAGMTHKGNRDVNCVDCHDSEAESFGKSPHSLADTTATDDMPVCATCHGGHNIESAGSPGARTSHRSSVGICTQCHTNVGVMERHEDVPSPEMIRAYEHSTHGRALLEGGISTAPACIDCHGSHSTLPSDDPSSPVFKKEISTTCGKCHGSTATAYNESVHGKALGLGILESPTCTDCHGEHDILSKLDPESHVYSINISKTCSDCHESESLIAKFGLKSDRLETFEESFHGIGVELEDTRVANCASCHGVHDIFSQSDPRSTINAANIEKTCGECHHDLPADFARGTVHTSPGSEGSGGSYNVRIFYYLFIPILLILFVLYRFLEYRKRSPKAK